MENNALTLDNRALFREWLKNEWATSDGVWLIFSKTDRLKTLSAREALEEALCFGWIDGQRQSIDGDKYKKYFTRRRAKSNWSEKNKELAQRLIETGLMNPPGLEAIACAKQNGQWDNSKRNSVSEEQISTFRQLIESHEPYRGITKGFYTGDTLKWNSVYIEKDVPDALIAELIEHSARQVVENLPKKKQEEYRTLNS